MPLKKIVSVPPGETAVVEDMTAAEESEYLSIDVDAIAAQKEREWRDNELIKSDYTQLLDSPGLTAQQVTDWATYRQELRDMPAQVGFPNSHTRPTKPV